MLVLLPRLNRFRLLPAILPGLLKLRRGVLLGLVLAFGLLNLIVIAQLPSQRVFRRNTKLVIN